MKVLITGATGFVGNNLARSFLLRGNEVGLILRKQSKNWRIKDISDKITKLNVDLGNKNDLKKEIKNYCPDLICHLATYGAYPKTQKNLEIMVDTNIKGIINLIKVSEGIPIINTGSTSEYGIKNSPMKEIDSCFPDNNYGWTKLSQTLCCMEHDIPTLRLSSIYGPWEEPARLIPTIIKAKLKDLPLNLINSVRDYTYVDDVTNAFIKTYENYNKAKGEIFNIGSGKQTNIKDILCEIDKINPKKLKINWNFKAIQTEPPIWLFDIKKAKKILGWKPRYGIKEGLRETYDWWEKYLG